METRRFQNGEREVVTSCATRIEAMEAVQLLADRKVDASCVTVTRHATSVAEVAPARRLQRALFGALLWGALGTLVAIALGNVWPVFVGLAFGAAVGVAIRRTSSVRYVGGTPTRIQIERHDVVTHLDQAAEARSLLEEAGFRAK